MACPGGCVGGGGQPKVRKNKDAILQKRGEGLNNIDRKKYESFKRKSRGSGNL